MSRPGRCASIQSVPRGARTGQAPLQVRQEPGKGRPASIQANRAPPRPQGSARNGAAFSGECVGNLRDSRPIQAERKLGFLLFAQGQVASLRGRGATSFRVGTGHLFGGMLLDRS
jgi:hypothetical protein